MPFLRALILAALAATPVCAGTLAPDLAARIAAAPEASRPVLVYLKEQPAAPPDRGARAAIAARRSLAARSQGPLLSILAARGAARVRPLWAVNAVAFTAPPAVIRAIAARPDVERVVDDPLLPGRDEPTEAPPAGSGLDFAPATWNVQRIGADIMWSMGITGAGVRVGVMDTGVDAAHVALTGKMAVGGWFDAVSAKPAPYDDNGHGTHVTGILCGGEVNGTSIGVAPGATYLAAKALNAQSQFQYSWVVAAGQWFLDPNGDGDPADAPDVVNCSWAFFSRTAADYHGMLELWHAAGILPVFAIGNSGPSSASALSPGTDPLVIGVGATNIFDTVADFSGRGPAPSDPPFNGVLKPDLMAPGVNVSSARVGGGVTSRNGTSMASPHVAGALALLRQRFPGIAFADAWRRLTESAVDKGTAGPDSVYGYGLLNVYAATQLPGPPGDADGDGYLSPADAVLALRLAGGLISDKAAASRADLVPPTGKVDVLDAAAILRAVSGL